MRISSRFLRTTLTSALLCVALSVTASAAYGSGVVTENSLRLREAANTSSDVLNMVDKGTKVVVLENQKNGWYKVDLNGTVGYMSANYLSVTPTQKTYIGKLNTGGSSLNMRSGPGTGYSKVGSVPASATLTITGSENGWYKTSYNGLTGYVSGDYVTVTETTSGSTTPSTPETPATPESPSETKPETPAPSTSGTGKLNTGGSSLNMRSGPGTSYRKVGSIPATATLTITGKENGWYKTSYNGVTGYVSGDYVTFTAAVETPAEPAPSTPPTETKPETPAETTPGTSGDTNTGPTNNTDLGAQVVAYAKKFLGIPYVYGANGPSSYDCSSFTQAVYKKFGYSLNRSAAGQYSNGTAIEASQVKPGDLLVWRAYGSSSTATHVGIYIGNDMYIHASSTGGCVTINKMSYGSNVRYLVGVRRIVG